LWRFEKNNLRINILQDGNYIESQSSLNFPTLPLIRVIPQYLQQSKTAGRNATLKAFRSWVRQQQLSSESK
jgi:hypothetical protein